MNLANRTRPLVAAALAAAGAMHGVYADRVALTNGDVLTGSVIEQSEQSITLEHALLGTIVIDANRVERVIRETPDESAEGQPPADTSEAIQQRSGANDTDLEAARADAKRTAERTEDPFAKVLSDWNHRLTLGLNGTAGNTEQQNVRVRFKSGYEDGRDRWAFDSSWFYARADGDQTQNQFQSSFTRDWLQEDRPWFFFLKGQHQYDERRSWQNRTSAFGGGGYTLAKNERVEINTRLGFGGTYEFGSVNEFTPEALFGGSVIKWHVTERAAISGETVYYPSLEDSANFRVESAVEWTYKLDAAEGLSLKLGLENEYDSNTPNETGNNDIRYYGAVVLSF
ncbi:MAG: DUF481 domain-containing protein [Phycisphaeraceae bacterium]